MCVGLVIVVMQRCRYLVGRGRGGRSLRTTTRESGYGRHMSAIDHCAASQRVECKTDGGASQDDHVKQTRAVVVPVTALRPDEAESVSRTTVPFIRLTVPDVRALAKERAGLPSAVRLLELPLDEQEVSQIELPVYPVAAQAQ